ncbi:MAG: ribonuclease P protein component [Alphaproteobacteria bacterium]|jgi:ribonuclease P protein component
MTERPGRIKQRSEFLAAAKGRKAGGRALGLQGRRRQSDEGFTGVRLGFTCSKKVGNAVMRNRARRRLKAAAAEVAPELGLDGCDYVLIGRTATIKHPFDKLLSDMRRAFKDVRGKLEGGQR